MTTTPTPLEQWQLENECKVCQARPNDEGGREHGKGCYAKREEGGGSDWPDGMPEPPSVWETISRKRGEWVQRMQVPGGWLYRIDSGYTELQIMWLPLVFVPDTTIDTVRRFKRALFPPNERKGRDRDPEHWLSKIEDLKPGDPCDVKIQSEWHPGVVIDNGGAGAWRVSLNAYGNSRCSPYIEHVRLPGQVDAWPLEQR